MLEIPVNIFIPFLGYFSINSSRSGLKITETLQADLAIADADLFSPSTKANSPKKSPLEKVARRGSFVNSLYEGLLGGPEDGAYPGLAGRDTIMER